MWVTLALSSQLHHLYPLRRLIPILVLSQTRYPDLKLQPLLPRRLALAIVLKQQADPQHHPARQVVDRLWVHRQPDTPVLLAHQQEAHICRQLVLRRFHPHSPQRQFLPPLARAFTLQAVHCLPVLVRVLHTAALIPARRQRRA